MDPKTSRGYMNNNPGNIDRSPNYRWNEEIRDPSDPRLSEFQRKELTKGRFCVFPKPEWGVRALVLNLQAYQRQGVRSIRAMVDRWAPPVENNTGAYINAVARSLGVSADTVVDMKDYKTAHAMAEAIIKHECGGNPYDGREIEDGLRLAGIIKPVTLGTSGALKGAATTISGGTISEAANHAQDAAVTIAPAAAASDWLTYLVLALKILGVVLMLVGVGWVVWDRFLRQKRDEKIEEVDDTQLPEEPSTTAGRPVKKGRNA